mmetsp:Transcript_133596/g.316679  ORF Transcript_133596/g.316679 Transcript_133596/m.316679 type:complete len:235 (-) Transcript_133596:50-754(-)
MLGLAAGVCLLQEVEERRCTSSLVGHLPHGIAHEVPEIRRQAPSKPVLQVREGQLKGALRLAVVEDVAQEQDLPPGRQLCVVSRVQLLWQFHRLCVREVPLLVLEVVQVRSAAAGTEALEGQGIRQCQRVLVLPKAPGLDRGEVQDLPDSHALNMLRRRAWNGSRRLLLLQHLVNGQLPLHGCSFREVLLPLLDGLDQSCPRLLGSCPRDLHQCLCRLRRDSVVEAPPDFADGI